MPITIKNLDEILKKSTLKNEDKVKAVLKEAGLAGDDASAVEACLRVLSSLGDKVSGATMAELQSLIGMSAPAATGSDASPKPVELAAPAMAAPAPKPVELAAAACPPDEKPVMKADGSLDWDAVPATLRPVLKALWSRGADAESKLGKVQKELDLERDAKVTREYTEVAGGFTHLAVKKEDLGAALKAVAVAAPKAYEQIHAVLKSANEVVAKSGALGEVGSSASGGAGAGTEVSYERIEQAALAQVVAKEKGMTKDAAVAHFITKTAEGRSMYSTYIKSNSAKGA